MFIIVQFPLADIRPLFAEGLGRLTRPDWRADSIPEGFIRGFGKISSRTQSGLSLRGERAFADCTQALKFMERIQLRQDNLRRPLQITPWFRRLYYDGEMSGRFEFGFLIKDEDEELVFHSSNNAAIRPSDVGKALLSTKVQIRSMDGSTTEAALCDCANTLGLAYVTATTNQAEISKFPPNEIYGSYVSIGNPIIHMRVSSGRYVETGRDRRLIGRDQGAEILFTSASGFPQRNGIIVQSSQSKTFDEQSDERITRVLFSHLNSILFAFSHAASASEAGKIVGGKKELRDMVKGMLDRLKRFSSRASNPEDEHLHAALTLFSEAYEGRIDELTEKLAAVSADLANPTMAERALNYVKGLHELSIKYAMEALVKASLR